MNARTSESVKVEKLGFFKDARGFVFEPLDGPELAGQQNSHVVLTEPGCVRGNHYHSRGTEVSVVVGPCLVRIKESTGVKDFPVADGEIVRFTIPPGVTHAMWNNGTRPMLIAAFNSVRLDREKPDQVRDVILEP
jgi:dTDP-4-dehydrorhamnose 3,5-epimerase-like enzyme